MPAIVLSVEPSVGGECIDRALSPDLAAALGHKLLELSGQDHAGAQATLQAIRATVNQDLIEQANRLGRWVSADRFAIRSNSDQWLTEANAWSPFRQDARLFATSGPALDKLTRLNDSARIITIPIRIPLDPDQADFSPVSLTPRKSSDCAWCNLEPGFSVSPPNESTNGQFWEVWDCEMETVCYAPTEAKANFVRDALNMAGDCPDHPDDPEARRRLEVERKRIADAMQATLEAAKKRGGQ